MIKRLFILIFISLLFSCSNPSPEAENSSSFVIYGNMEDGNGYKLYIKKIYSDSSANREVIEINEDGSFIQSIVSDNAEFYSLVNEAGNAITLFCGPGDSIKVAANYFDFREYNLSGNNESVQISLLNIATQKFLKKIEQFSSIIEDSIGSPDYAQIRMNIDKEYKEEYRNLKSFSENFIIENEGSLVSLLALSNQLGKNFFVFHPVSDKEIFYRVDDALYVKYPLYEPVEKLHYQVTSLKKNYSRNSILKIGDELALVSLADTSGIIINLQSLRGKIIFIDFWASWCKSCRIENLKYLDLYRQYKSNTFEIVQISLDDSKEDWKLAIEEDKLPWLQISDLKKWKSAAVELYGINELPANFLLNPVGEIIAKDIDAENLKKQLDNLLINK